MESAKTAEQNPLTNILVNIILPVVILNQLSKRFGEQGPRIAVGLALLLPLIFGLREWIQKRHLNPMSVIGLLNILVTGGFALSALQGKWFVLKEAAMPTLFGVAVLASAFTKKPFVQTMLINDKILKTENIYARLRETDQEHRFVEKLRWATVLLSISFAFSALVNFLLARHIFAEIDPGLSPVEQGVILNEQIARMTWMTALIIIVPSLLFTGGVLWYVLQSIHRLTGLTNEEILQG